jgi:predicted DsbA family dithiol-disulfide isomerase
VAALPIDVVADVVCPWCLIGTRRLDQALEAPPGIDATVTHHPFLLDPTTPAEGGDLRAHLRARYGVDPEGMFGRVEAAARSSGIPLDFSTVRRIPSTLAAHTLLRHAFAKGTQRALLRALFEAYFLKGQDIGDIGVLASVASGHGFDMDEVARVSRDEGELRQTRQESAEAAARGIRGVPFFVFGGRLAVSGAQPSDVLRAAVERALQA